MRLLFTITAVAALSAHIALPLDAAHEHPTTGPHKGQLLELGDEEYHAEILHDDKTGTVTIYVLDSKAKGPVATEAKDIAINVKVAGKLKQFKLKAAPQKSDKSGRSSRFAGVSKDLIAALDAEDSSPQLRIVINDKTFSARILHDHHHAH